MNLERKNALLKKKNEKLQEQLDDMKFRLLQREAELDSDELRDEFLMVIEELYDAIDGIRDTQKEYEALMKDMIKTRNEFKREMYRLNPMFIFRKRDRE